MADIPPPGSAPQDDRRSAIEQLVRDVRAALAAGRSVNEHSLMAAHPELMPELQEAFQALRAQADNAPLDDTNVAQTMVRPGRSTVSGAAGTPGETIARPGRTREPDLSGSVSPSATADSTVGADSAGGFGVPAGKAIQQLISIPGYSVQRELSRGGQAVVFIAIHLATGRKVALKVMREGPFADERSMARFQREVQILAALDHPNIVSIIDTGTTADGSHFIAMPYITGVTLDDYMKRRQQQKEPVDPSKLLRMFYKICVAVNEAHLRGIVHRDLKPANIRVDERGEPHILDFGLARSALDRFIKGTNEPVSITGEFMGSLPWSSPEQAEGDPEKVDMRTDVYSLGVILYQMLTGGRFPYEVVGNIRDVLNNILTTEPKPPSQMIAGVQAQKAQAGREVPAHSLPAVNEIIERIVLKALCKRKEGRYQNAGELGKDVARYLLGKQVKKDPPPAAPSKPQFEKAAEPSRHPWIFAVAGVAVCLALIVGAVVWTRMHKSTAHPTDIARNADAGATPDIPATPAPVVTGNNSPPAPTPVISAPSNPVSTSAPAPVAVTPAAPMTGDWVSLFNGQDFTGWDATPVWQVVNGAIVNNGRGAGTLTPQREYGSFHLRLKTKTSGTADVEFIPANSSTVGFSISNGTGGPKPNPTSGSIWVNAVMKAAARQIVIQQNEWFVLDIVYQGTRIIVKVNDEDVATYSDPALAGVRGRIVLKKLFGGGAQWTDIQIQNLDATGTLPPPTNAAATPSAIVGLPSKIGDTLTNTLGMKLAYVPKGQFTMGSPHSEPNREASEVQHLVTLTKPFLMETTDVTVADFKAFASASGYKTDAEKAGQAIVWNGTAADRSQTSRVTAGASWRNPGFAQVDAEPVVEISWNDAVAFGNWLSAKEKRHYRLPTEGEWEYACRAGKTTQYFFGGNRPALADWAWIASNSNRQPHPVAQKPPNAWGLYDMHGNVCQWCSDWFGNYAPDATTDPRGPNMGTEYCVRGGSWDMEAPDSRSAWRGHSKPAYSSNDNGFRVVLDLDSAFPGDTRSAQGPIPAATETAPTVPPH